MNSNVLLIEPDLLLGRTYQQALDQAGYQVVWQTDGQTGLMSADRQLPGSVVLELQLDSHSGVEFLYEFRSYAEWQHIPVIIHSLVPDQFSRLQKQKLGIAAYLYKPATSLRQLTETLRDVQVRLS